MTIIDRDFYIIGKMVGCRHPCNNSEVSFIGGHSRGVSPEETNTKPKNTDIVPVCVHPDAPRNRNGKPRVCHVKSADRGIVFQA